MSNKTILAIIIYLLWIGYNSVTFHFTKQDALMKEIDQRLVYGATTLNQVLPEKFHFKNMSLQTISSDQDWNNSVRLTTLSKNFELVYLYSLIRTNNKILFTASSVSDEEIKDKKSSSPYFTEYDDAPKELIKAFETNQIQFAKYSDKWGHFRSVFIPLTTQDGTQFISGADIKISHIEQQLTANLLQSLLNSCLSLLFILPFILVYRWEAIQSNKVLKVAKENADNANKEKSRFLANMSHELRTPMHAILSFSNIGLKKSETENQKKYFSKIIFSANRLMLLLNNLLDLSKLESGKMQLNLQNQLFTKVIFESITTLSGLAQDKEITVICNSHQPIKGIFDANLMGQVVINILSNAIKFGEKGSSILIEVNQNKKLLNGKSQSVIEFSVKDQGIGIPAEELDTIFDHFVQSSKTMSLAGGTGLGLSICKEIIDLHNGVIWAESPIVDTHLQSEDQITAGTLFKVVIPQN